MSVKVISDLDSMPLLLNYALEDLGVRTLE